METTPLHSHKITDKSWKSWYSYGRQQLYASDMKIICNGESPRLQSECIQNCLQGAGREGKPWRGGKGNEKCLISMWKSILLACWCLNLYHHTRVQDGKSEWTFARIFGSQSINSIENLLSKHLWNVGMIGKVKFFIWCEVESTFLCKHFAQHIFSYLFLPATPVRPSPLSYPDNVLTQNSR